MFGVPLREKEAQYISQLRREGFYIREIAELLGRNERTVRTYLQKEQKHLWAMKTEEYWQIVEQNKERLNKIIGLAIDAVDNSDGEEPAKIAAAVNAIEAQNKLLALPDFVKEQRAKNGTAQRLVLREDDAGIYAEPETEPELDDAPPS